MPDPNDLTRFALPAEYAEDWHIAEFYECEPDEVTDWMRDHYELDLAEQAAERRSER